LFPAEQLRIFAESRFASMKFMSFLRLLGGRRERSTTRRGKRSRSRKPLDVRLSLELLEERAVPAVLTINDTTVLEGNGGTPNQAIFTVSLDQVQTQDVTVNYGTVNGTATAGSDFQGISGTLKILAGRASGTIPVSINGNTVDQPNRNFFVALSNPSAGSSLSRTEGQATIIDDDGPNISIANTSVAEGDVSGQNNAVFTVTLSRTSPVDVVVHYQTADGTGTNAAKAGTDYTATQGDVTISAGTLTNTFSVPVIGNSKVE